MRNEQMRTCVIAGGGPAGMVAGLLLARAGVDVLVLEKHGDFLRDFRGDTIHPSTLQLLDELGLISAFMKIPHHRVESARLPGFDGGGVVPVDFRRLSHPYPYVALAPQWEFLTLLAEAAQREPCFELRMDTEVTGLRWSTAEENSGRPGARVIGVNVTGPEGKYEIPALLTIAADGRDSALPAQAHLPRKSTPVPLDVWWFRVDGDDDAVNTPMVFPRFASRYPILPIPRGDYVQAAMLIPKGSDADLRAQGVESFREEVATALPELASAAKSLQFRDVKLLNVQMTRLDRWWRSGLLCLGDAAHAMSPVGGVGVNLAVQDGVAAARILAEPLRHHTISDRHVAALQRRRMLPTRLTQTFQRRAHRGLERIFAQDDPMTLPRALTLALRQVPQLSGIVPKLIGVGIRPEPAPVWAQRQTDQSGRSCEDLS